MRVILLQTVPNLGQTGSILDVSDAHARNYLIPKKIARPATAKDQEAARVRAGNAQLERGRISKLMQEVEDRLAGQTLRIVVAGAPGGRPYAAVRSRDIFDQLKKDFGLTINGAQTDPPALKTFGSHSVRVVWPHEKTVNLTVILDPESN